MTLKTGTYIKRNGTYYRFSMIATSSYAAKLESDGWKGLGHKTVIVKEGPTKYAVYYNVPKKQYLDEMARRKQSKYVNPFVRKGKKKPGKGGQFGFGLGLGYE